MAEYVSRGGTKLERALQQFKIDVSGKTALDVGASTGGFTDCLLQAGAARVIAVDVGYGQFDARLRADSRVTLLERTNLIHAHRHLASGALVRLLPGWWEDVGAIRLQEGKYLESEEFLRDALRHNGHLLGAQINLGTACNLQGKFGPAAEAFRG